MFCVIFSMIHKQENLLYMHQQIINRSDNKWFDFFCMYNKPNTIQNNCQIHTQ